MTALPMPSFPVIPSFRITELVHASDRTLIYRGIREVDQQPVILKLLRQQPPSLDDDLRLRNHYHLTCNLNLPGVSSPLGFEPYGQSFVLITHDDRSYSLANFLDQFAQRRLSWPQFLPIAIQLSDILAGLHRHRIIHKDIKPSNILIQPETQQVTLIDFGLASQLPQETQTLQAPGLLEGTLPYLSPEQTGRMNRGIDYRSDFYALGVTFYELLTGLLPFQSDDPLELVYCHLAQEPVPPHERAPDAAIPAVLAQMVLKLMAKNAEDRYQSALGLKTDLERCLEQANETGTLTQFTLGQIDELSQFNIPQKLYGREAQINTLLEVFERVSQGSCELVLIGGYSGVGKTALVNEIFRQLTRYRGNFSSGKFEQFQRNIPLAAVMQAHRESIRQLLTESEATLQYWRDRFLQHLGANAQLIIEAIPELELVIGPQPPVSELGTIESANRLIRTFNQFVAAFQDSDHPRVLFMDDVQWADLTSMQSLQSFMEQGEHPYFLTIVAYRDNEVSSSHPFMQAVEAIRRTGTCVTEISLTPLEREHVTQIVAETLHAEAAAPLATLLFEKTAGNPFFLTQLLKSLYEDDLIWFDPHIRSAGNPVSGQWQWNLDQIQQCDVTDNVVELMIGKIIKLSEPTQRVLQLAACISNPFDLQMLAAVNRQSAMQTAKDLWEAIQAELIVPVGQRYRLPQVFSADEITNVLPPEEAITYRFLHDRVQQAAEALIPADQKQASHLTIGRLLLSRTRDQNSTEQIFEIVGHFNQGTSLITDAVERLQVAQLNLLAGRKARTTSAYAAAMQYLTTGLALLPNDRWQTQYDLTLEMTLALAEMAYLNVDFDRAEAFANQVLHYARHFLDRAKVYELKVQMYTAQNQLQQAVDTGLMLLDLLQIPLADAAPPGLNIQDLYDLPVMQETEKLIALKLLITIAAPAYNTNPALVPRLTLTMIHLCVEHGNSAMAAYAYAFYGMLLCATSENIELGYEFGRLALWVLEQFESRDLKGKVHHLFNVGIRHWKEPARTTLTAWQDTIQWNLEAGDIGYACYASMGYCINLLLVGEPLDAAQEKQAPYLRLIQELKQEFPWYGTTVWVELESALIDPARNRTQLMGNWFNEAVTLPILEETNNLQTLCALHLAKAMLHYWFNEIEPAAAAMTQAVKYAEAMAGLLASAELPFYESLIYLARCRSVNGTGNNKEQADALHQVALNQQRMRLWADHAPQNFQHKYELVEAERHRISGDRLEAVEAYDRAIAAARQNGYLQEEALANELAAQFYLDWGKPHIAQVYLQTAYTAYQRWGARAKLTVLAERYPELLQLAVPSTFQPFIPENSAAASEWHSVAPSARRSSEQPSTVSDTVNLLDLNTILKASRAISQEIQLERLLNILMQVVMENTGAQTGTLLLKSSEDWQIAAYCPDATTCYPQMTPLLTDSTNPLHLPLTVINYVQRTQTVVLIDDLASPNPFAADPYWLQVPPQSVLCLPILNQSQLIGVLYLENYLTAGAFTRDRQEVVQLIAAQAAISLENAQLYSTLEQRVAERTQALSQALTDLQTTQQGLIQSEKMAALGQLTASVAHEINTPLGVIRGATSNIIAAFEAAIQRLPLLLQQLSAQQTTEFLALIQTALQQKQLLSTQAERQQRRQYQKQLLDQGIAHADRLATQLTLLRLPDLSPFQTLLSDADAAKILDTAHDLVSQYQHARSIQQEVDRAAKIVFALKTYSYQNSTEERSRVDITEGIEIVLTLYQNRIRQGIQVIRRYDPTVPAVLCNPDELTQVWVNLIDNALYAIGQQGTLEIRVTSSSDQVVVEITDSGGGISAEQQARIFEPFFTTKPRGEGSGLGLDIVRQIVQKHDGTIQVNSQPGRTTFRIRFPVSFASSRIES